MNLRNPDSMNAVISAVLRYGVVISAVIIAVGTVLLVARSGTGEVSGLVTYYPSQVPHGNFDVSLGGLLAGLRNLEALSIIELGVLVLLSTPVARVLASIFLFAAEGDRTYAFITAAVLLLLLFSMVVTPFIPGFNR